MEIKSFKYPIPQITYLIKKKLWAQILAGLIAGLLLGYILGPEIGVVEKPIAESITSWLAIPANLFIKIIQMIIVPLIFASIIRGVAAAGSFEELRSLGIGTTMFFIITTMIAIGVGILMVTTIEPGNFVDSSSIFQSFGIEKTEVMVENVEFSLSTIPQTIVGVIPTNPLASALAGEMLSIIIFALFMALAMLSIPKKSAEPILDLLNSVQKVTMQVVSWAMRLAPFAAFGLMADITSKLGISALTGLGAYVVTVIIGLFVMMLIYIIIIKFFAKRPIGTTIQMMKTPITLAFSTSSSAAAMPESIKTAEEKLKITPEISQFIIPLGATINMNGTALFQIVAVFFLAQLFGIELSVMTILLITITALAASIGAPSVPGGGIVVLSTILVTAGIPVVGIILILGVDRLLNMVRAMVNVTGDLTACIFFDRRLGKLD